MCAGYMESMSRVSHRVVWAAGTDKCFQPTHASARLS